jgi:hypothetical protein
VDISQFLAYIDKTAGRAMKSSIEKLKSRYFLMIAREYVSPLEQFMQIYPEDSEKVNNTLNLLRSNFDFDTICENHNAIFNFILHEIKESDTSIDDFRQTEKGRHLTEELEAVKIVYRNGKDDYSEFFLDDFISMAQEQIRRKESKKTEDIPERQDEKYLPVIDLQVKKIITEIKLNPFLSDMINMFMHTSRHIHIDTGELQRFWGNYYSPAIVKTLSWLLTHFIVLTRWRYNLSDQLLGEIMEDMKVVLRDPSLSLKTLQSIPFFRIINEANFIHRCNQILVNDKVSPEARRGAVVNLMEYFSNPEKRRVLADEQLVEVLYQIMRSSDAASNLNFIRQIIRRYTEGEFSHKLFAITLKRLGMYRDEMIELCTFHEKKEVFQLIIYHIATSLRSILSRFMTDKNYQIPFALLNECLILFSDLGRYLLLDLVDCRLESFKNIIDPGTDNRLFIYNVNCEEVLFEVDIEKQQAYMDRLQTKYDRDQLSIRSLDEWLLVHNKN